MADFYKLRNQIKRYEWGSPDFIPRLMGHTSDMPFINGEPCAELWMGSHSGSPSLVSLPSGEMSLRELIAGDPRRYLGEKTAKRYDALPFLFKLLAAEKPLSIQAHPNLAQAREGFERENMAALAHDAPNRSYRDSNHKPEIICALTSFTGMCGFRSPDEIRRLLGIFLDPAPAPLREGFTPLVQALGMPMAESNPAAALRNFLEILFNLSPAVKNALTEFILSAHGTEDCEWELMRDFARLYPGDPSIIAPIYLNVFRLEPGEAVFLKAGILHAYIHGLGVELMADSDNVLRGGLTAKHIDIPELMKVLDFNPLKPQIIKPDCSCFTYPAPCEEFSLTVIHGTGGTATLSATLPAVFAQSASIGIVTEGEASVSGVILKQGESAFFPPAGNGEDPLVLRGNFTLYIASVPQ
ncbi:MAG: mannose-6-phosphate isomerase, class I [Treponema sp.]|jgi:mannose-6-phosphate isomerase|nr:mannose-6-phosphate isomerase, class I [Treponema sp.]